MPSIEKFVYRVLACQPEKVGSFEKQYVPVDRALATRPFLTQKRMAGRVRRASREFPQIITIRGQSFIIDGHHKLRRAFDAHLAALFSEVLHTNHELLLKELYKMSHGYIGDLEIL